ncbi:MAG: Crp/Fnr family transcriptional regulator [Bacteroidales bacterium]
MQIDPGFLDRYRLTPEDMQRTLGKYEPLHLKANEFFLKEGAVCRYLGYVVSGLLRAYIYDDQANEITQEFYPEGSLIISFDSFNNQVPSGENIKALEDCELRVITFENQQELYRELPVWSQICKDFSDKKNLEVLERTRQFQLLSATERYDRFCREHPHILQRANLGHIASFIGVDNATLSRIRRKK